MRALINSTVVDVSRKLGLTQEVVEETLERRVASQVDWSRFDHLGVLGIDEVSLRKDHRDFVTLINRRSREGGEVSVLAVLPDRLKETVAAFLASIPEHLQIGYFKPAHTKRPLKRRRETQS
ncbi:MAG: transposase [Candidatus Competibacteraceae bacterium]|nr:transposase [Candidatus Competibacteraceae bacterium]